MLFVKHEWYRLVLFQAQNAYPLNVAKRYSCKYLRDLTATGWQSAMRLEGWS